MEAETRRMNALVRLRERLAVAEAKRATFLQEIRLKAARVDQIRESITQKEAKRREDMSIKIEQSLQAASAARQRLLSERAARAARHASKARKTAESVREAAKACANKKLQDLERKMVKAERKRDAHLRAMRGKLQALNNLSENKEPNNEESIPEVATRDKNRHKEALHVKEEARGQNATSRTPSPSLSVERTMKVASKMNANDENSQTLTEGNEAINNILLNQIVIFLNVGLTINTSLFDVEKSKDLKPPLAKDEEATWTRTNKAKELSLPESSAECRCDHEIGIVGNSMGIDRIGESGLAPLPSNMLARSIAQAAAVATKGNKDDAPVTPSPSRSPGRVACGGVNDLPFDEFAAKLSSRVTLQATSELLKTIEDAVERLGCVTPGCDSLLQELSPPRPARKHRMRTKAEASNGGNSAGDMVEERDSSGNVPRKNSIISPKGCGSTSGCVTSSSRYPTRPFLSAYMVLVHPEVVMSGHGSAEEALAMASSLMIERFEVLLSSIRVDMQHQQSKAQRHSCEMSRGKCNFRLGVATFRRELFEGFDRAWVEYLSAFLTWKGIDAAGLESELIRAAVELESSRIAKMIQVQSSGRVRHARDLQALSEGVDRDLELITERINRLTGAAGVSRLQAALHAVRVVHQRDKNLNLDHRNKLSAENDITRAQHKASSADATTSSNSQPSSAEEDSGRKAGATTPSSDVSSRSPSKSPVKKLLRTNGTFVGRMTMPQRDGCGSPTASDTKENAANASPRSPKTPQSFVSVDTKAAMMSVESENSPNIDNSPSKSQAHGPEVSHRDEENLMLMWKLLYDQTWRFSTKELDVLWKDALESRDPVKEEVGSSVAPNLDGHVSTENINVQMQIRRIGEKAFWDGIRDEISKELHPNLNPSDDSYYPSKTAAEVTASGAGTARVAGLLAELGADILRVLPQSQQQYRQEVQERLGDVASIAKALMFPISQHAEEGEEEVEEEQARKRKHNRGLGLNVESLFGLLEWVTQLLLALGASERDAASLEAARHVRQRLEAVRNCRAMDDDTETPHQQDDIASIVSQALRLIALQLLFLRVDVANASLSALVATFGGDGLLEHVRTILSKPEFLGPPPETMTPQTEDLSSSSGDLYGLADRLPHTHGWLALASGMVRQFDHLMSFANSSEGDAFLTSTSHRVAHSCKEHPETSDSAVACHPIPNSLKSGRAGLGTAGVHVRSSYSTLARNQSSRGVENNDKGSLNRLLPVAPSHWRGLVRIGLVYLVTGEGAVTRLSMPETLRWETTRLFSLQNEFQRILVVNACLLCIRHLKKYDDTNGSELRASNSTVDDNLYRRIIERLSAMLSSSSVTLTDVAAELATVCSDDKVVEQKSLHETAFSLLKTMTSRGNPTLRAMKSGIGNALSTIILFGRDEMTGIHVAKRSLCRCGAEPLLQEVQALALQIGNVASVTESVCGPWYEGLAVERCRAENGSSSGDISV